jgi:hypothetical protein
LTADERVAMLPAMGFDELNDAMARSNARARRGRVLARLMFTATAGLIGFGAVVYLLTPSCFMCPMYIEPQGPITDDTVMAFGLAGLAVGLLWMWRIVRADPEPDSRSWRYRRGS